MTTARLLFWISSGFVVYVYVGYPLLLWFLQIIFRSSPQRQPIEPTVSLLVAAYNEAAVIADKIRNSLALDYPMDKLEIVVASDGSRDGTAEIVRGFYKSETSIETPSETPSAAGGRIRLLDYEKNRERWRF